MSTPRKQKGEAGLSVGQNVQQQAGKIHNERERPKIWLRVVKIELDQKITIESFLIAA